MEDAGKFNTFGRRVLAAFFDTGIYSCTFALILYSGSLSYGLTTYMQCLLINLIAVYCYAIITTYTIGGTFGKRVFNLVVVDANHLGKVSLLQAILREMLNIGLSLLAICVLIYSFKNQGHQAIISYITGKNRTLLMRIQDNLSLILGLAELGTCLFSNKRRALHDLIARTVVTKNKTVKWYFVLLALLITAIGMILSSRAYNSFKNAVLQFQ